MEAFANNATDRTYIAAQIQNSTSATGGIIYGAPRQYGVRVKATSVRDAQAQNFRLTVSAYSRGRPGCPSVMPVVVNWSNRVRK